MNNLPLIIIAIPFLAALGMLFLPRREKDLAQQVAMLATGATALLAAWASIKTWPATWSGTRTTHVCSKPVRYLPAKYILNPEMPASWSR